MSDVVVSKTQSVEKVRMIEIISDMRWNYYIGVTIGTV